MIAVIIDFFVGLFGAFSSGLMHNDWKKNKGKDKET